MGKNFAIGHFPGQLIRKEYYIIYIITLGFLISLRVKWEF